MKYNFNSNLDYQQDGLIRNVSELLNCSDIDELFIFNELEMCENPDKFLTDLWKVIPDHCFVTTTIHDPYDVFTSILRGSANLDFINYNWIGELERKMDLKSTRAALEKNNFKINEEDLDVGTITVTFSKKVAAE